MASCAGRSRRPSWAIAGRTPSCCSSSRRWPDALSKAPVLDTPEPALNRVFAWAVERAPRGVRADPGMRWADWEQDDLDSLVDDARRWQRVGRHAMDDAETLIAEVVGGLWGARADGDGGRFELSPWIVPGWKTMALRRLRLHRTLLDIEVRPRAEWITCRLESTFGPPVALALSLRNVPNVSRVTVDDVVLQGPRAIFTMAGEHEAVFYLGAPSSLAP